MHVAQTHAEFLAPDAKVVTGPRMLCHGAHFSANLAQTPLILEFRGNSCNALPLLMVGCSWQEGSYSKWPRS
jgi:hypothetical protein